MQNFLWSFVKVSKGSDRRKSQVSKKQFETNWDKIFNKGVKKNDVQKEKNQEKE